MKLVDISEFFSDLGGGVRTHAHQKLEACASVGVEATIIAPGDEDRRERRLGGEIIWVKSPTLAFDHRYYLFDRAKPVHDLLDVIRPDVIEGSSTWRGSWIARSWTGPAARALFLHQDPVAVYPHSLLAPGITEERLDQSFFWFWGYLRRLAKGFDSVVVGGRYFADRLARHGIERPEVIPLGIEKQMFSPALRNEARRREMLAACGVDDPDAALFLAVSRHHPEKRLGMVMDAFERVRSGRPAGLYIVGDGPAWRSVHRKARGLPNIKIAGQVADRGAIAEMFSSADYLVHGGAAETFGIVIGEALCSGLPFVGPDRGGASDLAGPGHSEIYRAGDADGCAEAMRRILARDRVELSKAAAAASHDLNTPRAHFDRLLSHYERLLQTRLETAAGHDERAATTRTGRHGMTAPQPDATLPEEPAGAGWISPAMRATFVARWQELKGRPETAIAFKWLRRATLAVVVGYLIFRLTHVGWREVYENLPESPLFYALFVARYFALPLSEIPAYKRVWKVPLWRHVTAFVRKRVYNFAVVGYSGEAFFTIWARRRLALSDGVILAGIKDNNILSAFASNFSTVALIIILALGDNLQPGLDALPGAAVLFALAFLSSFALVAGVMLFGRKVLHVDFRTAADLSIIHGVRMLAVMAIHASMYAAAIPSAPLSAWFLFVALQLVISRIPFLPNQDLVFLGAALSLAPVTGAPEAVIAGMLVAEAGLSQAFNVAMFVATAHDARETPKGKAAQHGLGGGAGLARARAPRPSDGPEEA
ncbi:MAG: glycosyltransferase [Alphaproteobacteria bacterium]|nr:glycosyltransferase [Alphaproteobacteria bacterium]